MDQLGSQFERTIVMRNKEQLTALLRAVHERIQLLEEQKVAIDLTLSELKAVVSETEERLSQKAGKLAS